MATVINDAIVKESIGGTEKIPCSGSGTPAITPDLLKEYFGAGWQDWTITFGGFSVDPTYTARYLVIGKLVFLQLNCTVNGTSNSADFTVSLPPGMLAKTGMVQGSTGFNGINNGTGITTAPRIVTASGSNVLTITRDPIGTTWGTANGKRASFQMFIEID